MRVEDKGLDVVEHACQCRPREAEAGVLSRVQDQLGISSKIGLGWATL